MSTTFEDYGLTAADVQSIMSANLHPVILLVFCHGIYTCFFVVTLYYILAQSARPKRKRMASIITFLWSINTILVALEWNLIDNIFIIHGISLEDKFDFYLYGGSIPKALTMDVFSKLGTILADVILIWRCWVMYGGSLVVLAIPSLCLVTETISASILIAVYYNPVTGASEVNWSLVYYSTTVVTNCLCTFLILFRIVRFSGVLGASFKTYRGVIRILVESAAMYAIIYIALLVAYAYEFYASQTVVMTAASYLQVVSVSITGIAPTLIIARVMAGHSRPNDSWTRPSLPHLRTPMRSIAESLRFASAPNHSTGTEQTTADNDVEQAREPDERDGEAEASASASHDEHTEGKSSETNYSPEVRTR